MSISRHLHTLVYTGGLLLALVFFYFSLSEWLFAWIYTDEIVPHNIYAKHGLLGCTTYYYFETTINRISADFAICAMANLQAWLGTPYLGWVTARLIIYALMPVCLAFLLKEFTQASYKFSLIAALAVLGVSFFMVSVPHFYLFGLTMAIYGTLVFSFFLLVAWFPKAVQNRRSFWWFCFFFALNLNSHEIGLVISGFFIPLYAWHQHQVRPDANWKKPLVDLFKDLSADSGTRILLAIYIASALLTLLAPGMQMRKALWPSTGTFTESMLYVFLSVEETIYRFSRSYVLLLAIMALGFCFRLSVKRHQKSDTLHKVMFAYFFLVSIVYLLVTAFFLGSTPSLWVYGTRPPEFRIVELFFTGKEKILNYGALALRQDLFFFVSLCANVFLIGFFLAGGLLKITWLHKALSQKIAYQFLFGAILTLLFLSHPGATGSVKALHALLGDNTLNDWNDRDLSESHAIAEYILPTGSVLSETIFYRPWQVDYKPFILSILTDKYVRSHRFVPVGIFNPIYDSMDRGYNVSKVPGWMTQIYFMYGAVSIDACISLFSKPNTESICYHTVGKEDLTKALRDKEAAPPTSIILQNAQNVQINSEAAPCPEVTDTLAQGEHFVAANDVPLTKGLHYFIFEALPTDTQLYIYLIGNNSLLIPWQNLMINQGEKTKANTSLRPVFRQSQTDGQRERLILVIDSEEEQTIQVRWQHAMGSTIYRGKKKNVSAICKAEHGQIVKR